MCLWLIRGSRPLRALFCNVAPGQSLPLEVSVAPLTQGVFTSVVTVTINGAKQPLKISLKATVILPGPQVGPVLAEPHPTITLLGNDFGSLPLKNYKLPYKGDTPYLEVTDVTQNWNASHNGDLCDVTLYQWQNNRIVFTLNVGAGALFGISICKLSEGDALTFTVWNPQTKRRVGPLSTSVAPPPVTGSFVMTGSMMPTSDDLSAARAYHTATLLNDGEVLIAGGVNELGFAVASAELYDPATGEFSQTGGMTTARAKATATLLNDSRVLIAGGVNGILGLALNSAEIYDPTSGTFSSAGNMTSARVGHSATLLPDGTVLIAGGTNKLGVTLNSAEVYDPDSNTFTSVGTMQQDFWDSTDVGGARTMHRASLLNDGEVLISGGLYKVPKGVFTASLFGFNLYEPQNRTFVASSLLGAPRFDHTSTSLNSGVDVLIVGGNTTFGAGLPEAAEGSFEFSLPYAGLYVHDSTNPENDAIQPLPGMVPTSDSPLGARAKHTATLLQQGSVLIAGGETTYGAKVQLSDEIDIDVALTSVLGSAEIFDPSSKEFYVTGSMNFPRVGHTATLLPNGDVLVVGGLVPGLSSGSNLVGFISCAVQQLKKFAGLCATPTAELFQPQQGAAGIYVANAGSVYGGTDSILVFPLNSNGDTKPIGAVTGPDTGLSEPEGLALDPAGNIYVTNFGNSSLTIYPPNSSNDATPGATIVGPDTGLFEPQGIALDASRDIYVANCGSCLFGLAPDSVTEYPPGSNGDAVPIATITGPDTGLSAPAGIALDSSGNIYVANPQGGPLGTGSITEYSPGSNGDTTPVATVTGAATQLSYPMGVSLDASGNIYVANDGGDTGGVDEVTVYPAGSNGNVAPEAVITGSATELLSPDLLAVAGGNIYVTNDAVEVGNADRITVYPIAGNGNVAPSAVITGSDTQLLSPLGIAVFPSE